MIHEHRCKCPKIYHKMEANDEVVHKCYEIVVNVMARTNIY